MLDLESAIKHCEEVAEKLEKQVKPYQCEAINKKLYKVNKKEWDDCLECAEEHRQLAEWLKELKALRENEDVKEVFKNCETCKYHDVDAYCLPCSKCMHRYKNLYIYDDKREVNADDSKKSIL